MIAIGFNLLRAFSMSFIKVKGKGHLLDNSLFSFWGWNFPSLHDLAGWIETFLILIAILVLARSARVGFSSRTLGDEISNWSNLKIYPNPSFSILILITVTASLILSKSHYASAEEKMVNLPKIELNLDDNSFYFEEQVISKQIAAQLHYKKGYSIQWQERFKTRKNPFTDKVSINPNYEYWQLFQASWDSGGACTAILSTHSPDSCLPLTGFIQVNPEVGQKPSLISLRVDDYDISFESYEFLKDRRKFFVYRCFWPHMNLPGQPNLFPSGGYSLKGRISASMSGKRNVGGTMLALALANVDSSQAALSKLKMLASQCLSLRKNEVQ